MATADPVGIGINDLRYGVEHDLQIIVLQSLFEEYSRTRRLTAGVMRRLAGLGIGSRAPDLPGMGESPVDLASVGFADWRGQLADQIALLPAGRRFIVSIRGGALLDSVVPDAHRWRLSPVDGASLVRDLDRAHRIAGRADDGDVLLRAGHRLNAALLAAIAEARPGEDASARTIRLESDPAAAAAHIPFAPLWRRAEPGDDPALADWIAQDIHDWIKTCV